jgi:hypothetical protein
MLHSSLLEIPPQIGGMLNLAATHSQRSWARLASTLGFAEIPPQIGGMLNLATTHTQRSWARLDATLLIA